MEEWIMNLKRCDNGHFFDGDKFQNCPHCAAIGGDANATMPYSDMGSGYNTAMTEPVTVPMSSYDSEPVTVPMTPPPAAPVPNPMPAPNPTPMPVPMPNPVPAPNPMPAQNMSLQDAVNRAVTGPNVMQDEEKTISIYQAKTGVDPVAGWLVCIEGEDFGDSFKNKIGKNFIGRASSMDIVLHGDNSISRERHAIILYEPKRREFIAQAGESRELFYLNDDVVLNPVRLKRRDILTIGNTRLMFFPCCGEAFSWDDYKRDES